MSAQNQLIIVTMSALTHQVITDAHAGKDLIYVLMEKVVEVKINVVYSIVTTPIV